VEMVYKLTTQKTGCLTLNLIATQANIIYKYKNSKMKILNCNSNTFANQQCLWNDLVPNYKNIVINQPCENTMGNVTLILPLLVKQEQ
jgi:hypothetical protein